MISKETYIKRLEKAIKEQEKNFLREAKARGFSGWLGEEFLTPRRLHQLKEGKISLKEAGEIAGKKSEKIVKKRVGQLKEKLYSALEQKDFEGGTLTITWHKGVCGWQAKATLADYQSRYEGGYTSGGGYDKRSTAMAEVFNQHKGIRKLLYTAKLKKSREKLGESLHYGVFDSNVFLPSWHGGTGAESFRGVWQALGFELVQIGGNDHCEVWTITRKAKQCKK